MIPSVESWIYFYEGVPYIFCRILDFNQQVEHTLITVKYSLITTIPCYEMIIIYIVIKIRGRCLPGDGKRMELEFAGGLFGTRLLDRPETVIRVEYA